MYVYALYKKLYCLFLENNRDVVVRGCARAYNDEEDKQAQCRNAAGGIEDLKECEICDEPLCNGSNKVVLRIHDVVLLLTLFFITNKLQNSFMS